MISSIWYWTFTELQHETNTQEGDLVSLWLPGHHSANSSFTTYPLLVRRSNKNYRCNRDTTQVNNLDFKQPRWCIVKLQAFIFKRQFGLKRWGRDAGVFYPKHRLRHLKLAWLIKSQTRADIPNTLRLIVALWSGASFDPPFRWWWACCCPPDQRGEEWKHIIASKASVSVFVLLKKQRNNIKMIWANFSQQECLKFACKELDSG